MSLLPISLGLEPPKFIEAEGVVKNTTLIQLHNLIDRHEINDRFPAHGFSWYNLSEHLLSHIFTYLSVEDLNSVSRVCKRVSKLERGLSLFPFDLIKKKYRVGIPITLNLHTPISSIQFRCFDRFPSKRQKVNFSGPNRSHSYGLNRFSHSHDRRTYYHDSFPFFILKQSKISFDLGQYLLSHIFTYLGAEDLSRVSRVCKDVSRGPLFPFRLIRENRQLKADIIPRFSKLDKNLLSHIFTYLGTEDLARISSLCEKVRNILEISINRIFPDICHSFHKMGMPQPPLHELLRTRSEMLSTTRYISPFFGSDHLSDFKPSEGLHFYSLDAGCGKIAASTVDRLFLEGDALDQNIYDAKIKIWDSEGQLLEEITYAHLKAVDRQLIKVVKIVKNHLVAGAEDGFIYVWNLSPVSFLKIVRFSDEPIIGIEEEDGVVTVANKNGSIYLFELDSVHNLNQYTIIQIKDVKKPLTCIAQKNNYLATGWGDGLVRIFDISENVFKDFSTDVKKVAILGDEQFVSPITSLCFNDKTLFCGDESGRIKAWNVKTGEELMAFIPSIRRTEKTFIKYSFNSNSIKCLEYWDGILFSGDLRGEIVANDLKYNTSKRLFNLENYISTGHTQIKIVGSNLICSSLSGRIRPKILKLGKLNTSYPLHQAIRKLFSERRLLELDDLRNDLRNLRNGWRKLKSSLGF
jgi:WD40 repeat protein